MHFVIFSNSRHSPHVRMQAVTANACSSHKALLAAMRLAHPAVSMSSHTAARLVPRHAQAGDTVKHNCEAVANPGFDRGRWILKTCEGR